MAFLNLHRSIFWDTNFSKLDKERDASFIIVRVFERGLLDDLIEILIQYNETQIKQVLLNAPYLSHRTLHFAKAYYNWFFRLYGATFKNWSKITNLFNLTI